MPQEPQPRVDHFVALDGVRGVGALTIVCGHALEAFGFEETVGHMQAGVDLFFALSGFVVGLSYQPRLEAGIGFTDYMIRRLIRLYPLLPLAVVWGAATYLLKAVMHGHGSLPAVAGSALLNALFLPSPLLNEEAGNIAWAINVPLWSLTSELFVSVLFGALLWKLPTRGLLLCAALGATGFALCALRFHDTNLGPGWYELDATLLRPVYPFCIGLWMWRVTRGQRSSERFPSWLGFVVVVAVLFVPRIAPKESALDLWFGLLIVWVVMPALLYVLAFMCRTSATSRRVHSVLGEASFPVYVLHFPLVMVLHFLGKRVGVGWWVLLGLDLALSLGIGYAAARLYDEPVRNWLTRLSKKRTGALALKRS